MLIKLRRAELCVVDEFRNGIDNGWTFRTVGAIVDLYDDGRLVVQGKNAKIVLAKLRRLKTFEAEMGVKCVKHEVMNKDRDNIPTFCGSMTRLFCHFNSF